MENERIKEIEEAIADLKDRWPPHSVPPSMWQQLEELEEKLEEAKRTNKRDGIFDTGRAHKLDEQSRIKELRLHELLTDLAGVMKGSTCVDFGSGTGTFALPMLELVGNEGKVYAVDNSDVMLGHIREKNPPPNLITIHSDVRQTGLDDSIADVCLLALILHEVNQPADVINEASRLLKSEGRLVIIEWKAEIDSPGPSRKKRLSREQIEELLSQAGLALTSYSDWTRNFYAAAGKKQPVKERK